MKDHWIITISKETPIVTPDPRIEAARQKAYTLYEGKRVPHYSCGICLAATFNLPTRPYQALRKGGITGEGQCGAVKAGEMVLGEYLGDPDPAGKVTPQLKEAIELYNRLWRTRHEIGKKSSIVCNELVGDYEDFMGSERKQFCTNLASEIAACVAEVLVTMNVDFEITPVR